MPDRTIEGMNAQDKSPLESHTECQCSFCIGCRTPAIQQTIGEMRLRSLIHSARIVVREIGSIAQQTEASDYLRNHGWPVAIMHAYDMACAHLTQLDPVGAAEFIKNTW